MSKTVTIALVWHSLNSDNLGVGALTHAQLKLLRELADDLGIKVKFLVLWWRDERPTYRKFDDVEVVTFRTRDLARPGGVLRRALRRADVVLDIGAGDSFTDIYGPKRFLTIWITKMRSRLNGKPLILSPQTIGPFNSRWSRILGRLSMNSSQLVVTRDTPSTEFVKQLGVRAPVMEATDVAMCMDFTPPAPKEDGKVKVGLNVSGLLFNGGYTGSNQFGLKDDYPSLIRRIAARFAAMDNVELHFVGHVQSADNVTEDDHRVGVKLSEEFPGSVAAPIFQTPEDAKSYIANMDFFSGARMHATIAAFSTGVPVIPMAYSRKFIGVFDTLGYPHVTDCRTDTAQEIEDAIFAGFENREALAKEVAAAHQNSQKRLAAYTEAVGKILVGL